MGHFVGSVHPKTKVFLYASIERSLFPPLLKRKKKEIRQFWDSHSTTMFLWTNVQFSLTSLGLHFYSRNATKGDLKESHDPKPTKDDKTVTTEGVRMNRKCSLLALKFARVCPFIVMEQQSCFSLTDWKGCHIEGHTLALSASALICFPPDLQGLLLSALDWFSNYAESQFHTTQITFFFLMKRLQT